jgi:hypothetical protein
MILDYNVFVADSHLLKGQRGVFAAGDFHENETIFQCHPFSADQNQPFSFINHSCRPNCYIRFFTVFAFRHIVSNEELTIDYRQIPFPIQKVEFDCQCGARDCAGRISLGT